MCNLVTDKYCHLIIPMSPVTHIYLEPDELFLFLNYNPASSHTSAIYYLLFIKSLRRLYKALLSHKMPTTLDLGHI